MIRRQPQLVGPSVGSTPRRSTELAALNGHAHEAAELFAAELARGEIPAIRAIRSGLHVGQDKASQVQNYLRTQSPVTSTRRRADF